MSQDEASELSPPTYKDAREGEQWADSGKDEERKRQQFGAYLECVGRGRFEILVGTTKGNDERKGALRKGGNLQW